MSTHELRTDTQLVLTIGDDTADLCRKAGLRHVKNAGRPDLLLDGEGRVHPEIEFFGRYVILIPDGGENVRDAIAINLGDERCKWAYLPMRPVDIPAAVSGARPMWTDEVSTIDDVPDPGEIKTYKSGFPELDGDRKLSKGDDYQFRITTPAFMPIIGPYGSGKSVFLRQLLINLWQLHGWKFLLTSFEEKVKPRYLRDLRRHLICNGPQDDPVTGLERWRVRMGKVEFQPEAVAWADNEIRRSAVFLRRKRSTTLDLNRLLDRIEFAVRVHGVKVVAIDPVNEIDHQVPKGESKTDYMGKFIMALKALADDYDLLMICCAHPPKDGVEKRLSRTGLLTLNDGADTAHWGNKADIGLCLWRNIDGPTLLHGDKLKDHETNGKPFLAELTLQPHANAFRVTRMGYDIIGDQEAA